MSSPTFFDQQKELIRTDETYTKGMVNVPQNTPAQIFFICSHDKPEDMTTAIQAFYQHNMSFIVSKKRTRSLLFSQDVLTFAQQLEIFKKFPEFRSAKLLKRMTDYRYTFFELDTTDSDQFNFVVGIFQQYSLPVYFHRTMRGWHFFSIKPIRSALYQEVMRHLKPLNVACPHVTLRVQPNKWVGEMQVFKMGGVKMGTFHYDTMRLQQAIENQQYDYLYKHYLIVTYRQNGEMGNL